MGASEAAVWLTWVTTLAILAFVIIVTVFVVVFVKKQIGTKGAQLLTEFNDTK